MGTKRESAHAQSRFSLVQAGAKNLAMELDNHERHDDIVVFTLHKSASMFIHRQCELLCRLAGIEYHSPNVPGSGMEARRLLLDQDLWRLRHGCFAPVRFFVDIPQVDDYRIILHLRDPRDVLVSMFYSYCFIHAGEVEANTGYRREVAAKGIDAFVLAKASESSTEMRGDYGTGGHVEDLIGNLPKRYADYVHRLLGRPNVLLVKYEEMVTDYRSWLEKFITPFPIRDKPALIDQLAAQAPTLFPRRSSDAMTHIRHVTPGDYKAKLQLSTIRQLDEIFAGPLEALGYPKHAS
jgi:Sulfotransferase domain